MMSLITSGQTGKPILDAVAHIVAVFGREVALCFGILRKLLALVFLFSSNGGRIGFPFSQELGSKLVSVFRRQVRAPKTSTS